MPQSPTARRQRRRANRVWEVQGGVAQLKTPGMTGATITPMSSTVLDSEIARLTEEQTMLTARAATVQDELVEIADELTELTDLRATVTAEPA
jgi:hypothetical protein